MLTWHQSEGCAFSPAQTKQKRRCNLNAHLEEFVCAAPFSRDWYYYTPLRFLSLAVLQAGYSISQNFRAYSFSDPMKNLLWWKAEFVWIHEMFLLLTAVVQLYADYRLVSQDSPSQLLSPSFVVPLNRLRYGCWIQWCVEGSVLLKTDLL